MENNKSGFKYPITIKDAILNIESRKYLLPAIQRKFVWSSEQIEVLFDSIIYHKDHLHPASKFLKLTESDFGGNENKYKFYTNPENWNSILNLQLLSSATNESKNDEDLASWVEAKNIDLASQIIPTDVSLKFDDFEVFLSKRKELLTTTIKSIIGA